MASIFAIVFAVTSALVDSVAGPGYVAVGGHDGVAVYLRKDSAIVDLVAVGDFSASPAEVRAALLSYEEHPAYLHRVSKSNVLHRSASELVVYQTLKLPVISDRDYTLAVSWSEVGMRFHVTRDEGPAPSKKVVRMTLLEGSWELRALDGGGTRATYRVHMDLGGSVPRGMVRNGSAKEIPDIYQAYRKLVVAHRAKGLTASLP